VAESFARSCLFEGSIMPEFHPLPDYINVQIQRPACPRCHTHMMLARIMPVRIGFDLRIFECSNCDHAQEVMVATEALEQSFIPLA
jgi:uncharacterized protein (UPF0212 family)